MLRIMAMLLLLAAVGCAGLTAPARVTQSVRNQLSADVKGARVRFAASECAWGQVGRTFEASVGDYPHAITPEAELSWFDGEDQHIQTFDLSTVYPPGASGWLRFTIRADKADVEFVPRTR